MFHVVECDTYLLSHLESQLYYICMLLNKENMNNYCKMFGANIFLLWNYHIDCRHVSDLFQVFLQVLVWSSYDEEIVKK